MGVDKSIRKNGIKYVIVLTILILALPLAFRVFNERFVFYGVDQYYDLRMSKQVTEIWPIQIDMLSFGENIYIMNLLHLSSHYMLKFMGVWIFYIIPVMSGVITAFLLYLLLVSLGLKKQSSLITCLFFITSPIFIFTFTTLNSFNLLFPLLLGAHLLMLKGMRVISVVLFLFTLCLGPLGLLIAFSSIFIAPWVSKKAIHEYKYNYKVNKSYYIVFVIMAILSLIYYLSILFRLGIPPNLAFGGINGINDFISDFGGLYSIGLIMLFMGIIGIFISWKNKKILFPMHASLIVALIVFIFYSAHIMILIALLLSFFVMITLEKMFYLGAKAKVYRKGWKNNVLKQLTFMIIVCIFFFSLFTFSSRIIDLEPHSETVDCFNILKEKNNGFVLSHYSKGYWIEELASKKAFTDNNYYYIPDFQERMNVSNNLFYSRNLRLTRQLMEENDIKYIFIDSEMKSGLVWEKERQGLLELLPNNKTFKVICSNPYAEVWEFIPNED